MWSSIVSVQKVFISSAVRVCYQKNISKSNCLAPFLVSDIEQLVPYSMQFLIGRAVCQRFKYPLSRNLTLLPPKKSKMSQQVFAAAAENANFFLKDTSKSGRALYYGFQQLAAQCQEVTPLLEKIKRESPKFDLDVETPGNGYRSFGIIFEALFKRCVALCDLVKTQRGQMVFNLYKYSYIQDLKSWNEMLVSLST